MRDVINKEAIASGDYFIWCKTDEGRRQFKHHQQDLDNLLNTFFTFINNSEACNSYFELMDIMFELINKKEASKYIDDINQFMQDAKNFVANSQVISVFDAKKNKPQDLDTAKNNLIKSANKLSQQMAPTRGEIFLGALQIFVGSLLSLVSLGCISSVRNNGYRLFSGYRSNQVTVFKNSLLSAQERLKPQAQNMC